jgi:23S rRNA pseudouridine2604 synthase
MKINPKSRINRKKKRITKNFSIKKKIEKKFSKAPSTAKATRKILGEIKKTKHKVKTLVKSRSIHEAKIDNEDQDYPMRLSRHMYLKNLSSRREADRLIESDEVLVNGEIAVLGMKILETDIVTLAKTAKKKLAQKQIVIFNKPIGVVSHNPQNGEKEPNDFLSFTEKLSPIGRLDKMSHGLLLMSNDGRLVDRLLNPKFFHEKEYIVRVDKHLNAEFYTAMEHGVDIEGYMTKPAKIKKVAPMIFSLTLTEGKKHQIRRMCAALGYQVEDLQRVRFLNITLKDMPTGEYRKLTSEEQNKLMERIDSQQNNDLI